MWCPCGWAGWTPKHPVSAPRETCGSGVIPAHQPPPGTTYAWWTQNGKPNYAILRRNGDMKIVEIMIPSVIILRYQIFLVHVWQNQVVGFFQRTLIFANFADSHDRIESAIWWPRLNIKIPKENHVVKDPKKASLIASLVFSLQNPSSAKTSPAWWWDVEYAWALAKPKTVSKSYICCLWNGVLRERSQSIFFRRTFEPWTVQVFCK